MENQGKGDVDSAVSLAAANRGYGPNGLRAVEEIIACCRQTRLVSAGEHIFE